MANTNGWNEPALPQPSIVVLASPPSAAAVCAAKAPISAADWVSTRVTGSPVSGSTDVAMTWAVGPAQSASTTRTCGPSIESTSFGPRRSVRSEATVSRTGSPG